MSVYRIFVSCTYAHTHMYIFLLYAHTCMHACTHTHTHASTHTHTHTHTHMQQSQQDDTSKIIGCYSVKWTVKRQDLSLDLMLSRVFACLTSEGTSPVTEWQSSRMSGLFGFSYVMQLNLCFFLSWLLSIQPSHETEGGGGQGQSQGAAGTKR